MTRLPTLTLTAQRSLLLSLGFMSALFASSTLISCDDLDPELLLGGIEAGVQAGTEEEVEWLREANFTREGVVMSVWGTGDTVYSVGGQPDEGRIWSRGLSAEAGAGEWALMPGVPRGPLLNWVHGADGHLWVVGNDGRALRSVDGGAWEAFNTGTSQDLWGVFAVSAREVWAVGGDANGDGDARPVLLRYDGEQWSAVPIPALDRSGVRAFFKVWSDGEGRVWVVGMKGVIIADLGEGWAQQTVSPNGDAPPNAEDLISLWGSQGEVVAVGGRSNGVIARWDGRSWRAQTISGLPGLNGVWVDQAGVAHAVGVRGSAVTVAPGSFDVERQRTYETYVLHAIWSDEVSRWTVGGTLDNAPPWEGVILAD